MRERVDLKSPVREYRPPGSVRGAPGNRRPYLDKSWPGLPQPLRERAHHRLVLRAVAEENVVFESRIHRARRLEDRGIKCKGVDAAAAGAAWSSTQLPNSNSQTTPGPGSRFSSEGRQTRWLISGDQVMRQWRLTRRLHTLLPIARPS
jgi:hypothetical protein